MGRWREDAERSVVESEETSSAQSHGCQPRRCSLDDPRHFASFLKSSRCAFTSCYLYMAMFLQRGSTNSFITNWLIEQFLDDATRTERSFIDGNCNRNVWFWTMIFGLSAVASTTASNALEENQISLWRDALNGKIRLANEIMHINDWNAAKSSLRRVCSGGRVRWRDRAPASLGAGRFSVRLQRASQPREAMMSLRSTGPRWGMGKYKGPCLKCRLWPWRGEYSRKDVPPGNKSGSLGCEHRLPRTSALGSWPCSLVLHWLGGDHSSSCETAFAELHGEGWLESDEPPQASGAIHQASWS